MLKRIIKKVFYAFLIIAVISGQTAVMPRAYAQTANADVSVRIEADDHTIMPKTQVEVSNFDLTKYGCTGVSSEPTVLHAVIKALEANGKDPSDSSKYNFNGGDYVTEIDGLKSSTKVDGWGYFVNNGMAMNALNNETVKDGDSIVLFYFKDYQNLSYSFFDKEKLDIAPDQAANLKLSGIDFSTAKEAPIAGAEILINGQKTGKTTDDSGNVSLSFDKTGTYDITAEKTGSDGNEMISRPFSEISVSSIAQSGPIISTDIKNGTVSSSVLKFSVSAQDASGNVIVPAVNVNGTEIKPSQDGSYSVNLNPGGNSISIIAYDKSGVKAEKNITVTYNPASSGGSVDINKELNQTLGYMKNNNSDMWSAISLSKFGIKGNKELFDQTVKQFSEGVSKDGLQKYYSQNTDLEKMIMYVVSQGYNPYDFMGYNLVKELLSRDINTFDAYSVIYGLYTYDYANIEGDYNISKDQLMKKLLSMKITASDAGGSKLTGWNIYGSDIDPDTTAAAIEALSSYYDKNSDVKTAVDQAVDTLSEIQKSDGGLEAWGSEASESLSFAIMALTSVGIDPQSSLFTKTDAGKINNLVTALLSFKGTDGQFKHVTDGGNDYIATEEALRALISLSDFYTGGKYNYYSNNIDPSNLPLYTQNNIPTEPAGNLSKLPQTGYPVDTDVLALLGVILAVSGCVLLRRREVK